MTTPQIIGIIAAVIVIAAIAAWFGTRRNRTKHLQDHFGPEYDRRLAETGNRSKAEAELAESEARVRSVRVRPLSETDRARYLESWRLCQARFVDDPADAVMDADGLLSDIMRTRGYNVDNPMNRSTDICAAYPNHAATFRESSDIVIRHRRGDASTEELRKAFINYRALFEEILGREKMKNLNEPHDPAIADGNHEQTDSLIPAQQVDELRQRWISVQSHFVDEPRQSVEEADQLVAAAIKQIEEGFSAGRSSLEKQWSRGDEASTEDLRICLQHYRQFFDRLLSRV